jgi:hypothetical protein
MKGFSIQPAPQGIYPALCHLGDTLVPLTDEGLARLKAATEAPPMEFYRLFLEVVGASAYLKERIAQLWGSGDAGEQARSLQQALKRFPVR